MKKLLFCLAALAAALCLSACSSQTVPGLDWEASEMVKLEAYTGEVPTDAKEKETEDPDVIRAVAEDLKKLREDGEASIYDMPDGGIGLYLKFIRADGTSETAHLSSDGLLLATGTGADAGPESIGFYKLKQGFDNDGTWASIPGEESPVSEDQLPVAGSAGAEG